jgi:hypothetical protein
LRSAIWIPTDPETPHSEMDDAIVQALGEVPFALVKELSRRPCCAPTTIYRCLTESLHYVSKHLQWVPHDLTITQKVRRVHRQTSFLDSSSRPDTTTEPCSSHWMGASLTFAKSLNESGLVFHLRMARFHRKSTWSPLSGLTGHSYLPDTHCAVTSCISVLPRPESLLILFTAMNFRWSIADCSRLCGPGDGLCREPIERRVWSADSEATFWRPGVVPIESRQATLCALLAVNQFVSSARHFRCGIERTNNCHPETRQYSQKVTRRPRVAAVSRHKTKEWYQTSACS